MENEKLQESQPSAEAEKSNTRIDLSNVTLVCFENADKEKATALIEDMKRVAKFGDVMWIDRHRTLLEFQKAEFLIGENCKTSHLLTVHLDGFILNPEMWNPEWLQYDYIGAPWPLNHFRHMNNTWIHRVGNSGFSLRSARLCKRAAQWIGNYPVFDLLVGQVRRYDFDSAGFKIAPLDVAAQFSTEIPCEATVPKPFGFHGVWPTENNPPEYYKIGTCAKQWAAKKAAERSDRVVLLTADGPSSPRTEFARATHTGAEYHVVKCLTTAADMGDEKGCYYINDILDLSLQLSGDIFVYVNNDVALVPEWRDEIIKAVHKHGCAFSQRLDVPKFIKQLTLRDMAGQPGYVGSDVFAVTPQWWREHRDNFPRLPLGYEGWDAVLTYLMRKSGFQRGTIICYHETHGTAWWNQNRNEQHPAIIENRRRQEEWAKKNGLEHLLHAPHGYLWKSDIFMF